MVDTCKYALPPITANAPLKRFRLITWTSQDLWIIQLTNMHISHFLVDRRWRLKRRIFLAGQAAMSGRVGHIDVAFLDVFFLTVALRVARSVHLQTSRLVSFISFLFLSGAPVPSCACWTWQLEDCFLLFTQQATFQCWCFHSVCSARKQMAPASRLLVEI